MMIAGPRVAEQIGKDYNLFKKLATKNSKGNPVLAILFLAIVSCFLVVFSSSFHPTRPLCTGMNRSKAFAKILIFRMARSSSMRSLGRRGDFCCPPSYNTCPGTVITPFKNRNG